jgi:hypothetical protein
MRRQGSELEEKGAFLAPWDRHGEDVWSNTVVALPEEYLEYVYGLGKGTESDGETSPRGEALCASAGCGFCS